MIKSRGLYDDMMISVYPEMGPNDLKIGQISKADLNKAFEIPIVFTMDDFRSLMLKRMERIERIDKEFNPNPFLSGTSSNSEGGALTIDDLRKVLAKISSKDVRTQTGIKLSYTTWATLRSDAAAANSITVDCSVGRPSIMGMTVYFDNDLDDGVIVPVY